MIPVSAPSRVHGWLRSGADGAVAVVHRGSDAAYLDVGGRCVGLLGRRAVQVPCGLRSQLDRVEVGEASLHRGVLHVDGLAVRVGRFADVTVPSVRASVATPAPAPAQIRTIGRGDGLTPYDDDVLCGWLAAHRAAGVPTPEVDAEVRSQLHRTTLLSATLLECALHGEVVPEYAAWLRALDTPGEAAATAALAGLGHSSGRGMLAGGRLALSHLHPLLGAA